MASAPRYKIFNPEGEYVAACKYPEEAAALMTFLGDGAEIRDGHTKVVWTEGSELQPAAESYDFVTMKIEERTLVTQ